MNQQREFHHAAPVTSGVVREILKKYPTLDINELVMKAKGRGVTSTDKVDGEAEPRRMQPVSSSLRSGGEAGLE